ncbi:MAG TPA: YaaL family protein [Bacillota bacterium]|nr:YaaL family protein [Bacillota bacterium]
MRKRARQAKRREINEQLLQSIYKLQHEWQHLRSIIDRSVGPIDHLVYQKNIAQLKYVYLLKEAQKRNMRARAINL